MNEAWKRFGRDKVALAGAARRPGGAQGRDAEPGNPAARLPLPPALPQGDGCLPRHPAPRDRHRRARRTALGARPPVLTRRARLRWVADLNVPREYPPANFATTESVPERCWPAALTRGLANAE